MTFLPVLFATRVPEPLALLNGLSAAQDIPEEGKIMDDESFTCVVSPCGTIKECFERLMREQPPSLENNNNNNVEGRTWSMLIPRKEFVKDMLQPFLRSYSQSRVADGVGNGPPHTDIACGYLPTVVRPSSDTTLCSVPSCFGCGEWSAVWNQFERDVHRETLVVGGVECRTAEEGLRHLSKLIEDAHDEIYPGDVGGAESKTPERAQRKQLPFQIGSLKTFFEKIIGKDTYEEKRRKRIEEAIRLAVLAAQQTILALPLELLTTQFCTPADVDGDDCVDGNVTEQMVHIGELNCKHEKEGGNEEGGQIGHLRRMFVNVGRPKGHRLPTVRTEKRLHVFVTNEQSISEPRLQLRIVIDINLLANDHVELTWEWGPP